MLEVRNKARSKFKTVGRITLPTAEATLRWLTHSHTASFWHIQKQQMFSQALDQGTHLKFIPSFQTWPFGTCFETQNSQNKSIDFLLTQELILNYLTLKKAPC